MQTQIAECWLFFPALLSKNDRYKWHVSSLAFQQQTFEPGAIRDTLFTSYFKRKENTSSHESGTVKKIYIGNTTTVLRLYLNKQQVELANMSPNWNRKGHAGLAKLMKAKLDL